MKHLFLALLVALCLSPDPAEAGIVASAIGAFLATTGAGAGVFGGLSAAFGVLTSTFVGRLIVGAALSLAGQLLQKKPKAVVRGIQTEQTTTGDVTPQKFVVGTYALEGHAVAPAYSRGPDNRILTYILEISNKPVEGLTGRVIIDGQYATIEAPDAGSRDRQVLTELRQDDNDPTAWMWFYDGTQTTAAQTLVDDYGSHPDRPWANTFIGEGTAYAIMEFFLDREFYSGLPAVRFEVKGIRLYDPRKDTTVGGSGAHRWGDESTYEWTDNPQVINYNILRGITLPTGDIYGGQVPAEDLPLDNWFAAMNECDVLIGSRKQFTAGFEINVGEMEPFEVIQEMNRASFAQMSEFGGVFRVRVGAPASAVLSVTDDDFVITESSQYIPFPGLAETHNAITGTYVEPVDVWQARSADSVTKPDWETEDGGRRLTLNIDLPAVSVKSQAQHLLNAYLEDNRRFRVHRMGLPPSFAEIEPLDVISFTSEINGYTSKAFEVIEVESRSDTLLQIVTVREREAGDVAWTSGDDVPAPSPSNGLTKPSDLVPTLTLTGVTIDDDSSDDVLPAIKIEWAETGFAPTDSIKWEVRKTTGATIVASGITGADSGETVVAGIAGNTSYEVRARYVVGVPTAWSAWSAITTPNVSFGGTAGTDGLNQFMVQLHQKNTSPSSPPGDPTQEATYSFSVPGLFFQTGGDEGWTEDAPSLAKGEYLWRITARASSTTGTDVIQPADWSGAVIVGIGGEDGAAGSDGADGSDGATGADGSDGLSVAELQIFQRLGAQPSTPTGGEYDFGTKTLTPPLGWSDSVPATNGDPLWTSKATASVQGTTGTDTSLTWSTPAKIAEDGVRGPGRWHIPVTSLPTTSGEAQTAWDADTDTPDDPQESDQAWFYTGTEANPTGQSVWIYRGTSWAEQDEVIDGNLLVSGTVTANKVSIGDSSLSADAQGDLIVQGGNITVLEDNFYTANLPVDGQGWSSPPVASDLSLVGGNAVVIPAGFTADLQVVVSFEHGYFNLPGNADSWGLSIQAGSNVVWTRTTPQYLTVGEDYTILDLGDTDWNAVAGTTGVNYEVDDTFTAAARGSGSGLVEGLGVQTLYERFENPMSLETDFASVVVVSRNIRNPDPVERSTNIFVRWNGGSSDIRLQRCLSSVFMRFK